MDRSRFSGPLTPRVEQEVRDLYLSEAAGLLRLAVSVSGSTEAAQDAVQEAFLRFFVARTAGQDIRNPKAWLFRVLRNHLLDQKKAGSHREVGLESLMNAPGPGRDPEAAYGRTEALRSALRASLTPREIECVELRNSGLRYDEIATVLKLQSGTVGALLTRAHKKIRAAAVDDRGGELILKIATRKRYAS